MSPAKDFSKPGPLPVRQQSWRSGAKSRAGAGSELKEKSSGLDDYHKVHPFMPAPADTSLTPKLHALFGSGVELNAAVATKGSVDPFPTL